MATTPVDYLGMILWHVEVCGGPLYWRTGAGLAGMDAPHVLVCCCIHSLHATVISNEENAL